MVQSEVADRLVAPPGSRTYGIPSVKMAWYAAAVRVGTGGALGVLARPRCRFGSGGHPTSASAGEPQLHGLSVFRVVDAAFAQRRKMLRSALAGLIGSSAPRASDPS